MTEYSALFISAEAGLVDNLVALLSGDQKRRVEVTRVETLFDGLRECQDRSFDLVISDLFLPDGQGHATLRHLHEHAPRTPVIILCHAADRDAAVTAVSKGAHDFFCLEDLDTLSFQKSVDAALKAKPRPPATEAGDKDAERRTNARFDCRLAVSYQTLEKPFLSGQGSSETLNISSKGVLFKADKSLEPGQLLQVSVDWPARLENQIPLKLVAEGRIVRNVDGIVAMAIEKYEFRTRRTTVQAANSPQNTPDAAGRDRPANDLLQSAKSKSPRLVRRRVDR
jgi:DNA-binding NarL/FixJ family response regulator